jgi:hypothetical protein
VFFWSRLVYLVYYAGIPALRTAVWGVSIVGLAMMILSMPPGTVNIDIGKTTLYYVLGHGGTSDEVIERSRSSAVH